MGRQYDIAQRSCQKCAGLKTITNPEWSKAIAALTEAELALGVKLDIPQKIPCSECKGLGVVMSDDFWALRAMLKLADEMEAAAKPNKPAEAGS